MLMAICLFVLAAGNGSTFFVALALIAGGTGLLKPDVSYK